jgi:hypothetical protein
VERGYNKFECGDVLVPVHAEEPGRPQRKRLAKIRRHCRRLVCRTIIRLTARLTDGIQRIADQGGLDVPGVEADITPSGLKLCRR